MIIIIDSNRINLINPPLFPTSSWSSEELFPLSPPCSTPRCLPWKLRSLPGSTSRCPRFPHRRSRLRGRDPI